MASRRRGFYEWEKCKMEPLAALITARVKSCCYEDEVNTKSKSLVPPLAFLFPILLAEFNKELGGKK